MSKPDMIWCDSCYCWHLWGAKPTKPPPSIRWRRAVNTVADRLVFAPVAAISTRVSEWAGWSETPPFAAPAPYVQHTPNSCYAEHPDTVAERAQRHHGFVRRMAN